MIQIQITPNTSEDPQILRFLKFFQYLSQPNAHAWPLGTEYPRKKISVYYCRRLLGIFLWHLIYMYEENVNIMKTVFDINKIILWDNDI